MTMEEQKVIFEMFGVIMRALEVIIENTKKLEKPRRPFKEK